VWHLPKLTTGDRQWPGTTGKPTCYVQFQTHLQDSEVLVVWHCGLTFVDSCARGTCIVAVASNVLDGEVNRRTVTFAGDRLSLPDKGLPRLNLTSYGRQKWNGTGHDCRCVAIVPAEELEHLPVMS
jgi:hypothetical protein